MQTAQTTLSDVANALRERDYFLILTHQYPDGDTVGSAFALCRALQKLNKHARVIINGNLDKKFLFLKDELFEEDFEPQTIVAVDIASEQLLGDIRAEFEGKIDIRIDHHATETTFAPLSYVNPKAAANTENIWELIKLLGVDIDKHIANAIYIGICTDTGCFKFSNVTPYTMRCAAELMELNCDSAEINRVIFDTKSLARLKLERAVLDSLTVYDNGRIAVVNTTIAMEKELGVGDSDMDGIASIPRQIEGVLIGITIKEKKENYFRASIRSIGQYNAANVGSAFGGGGHHAAAGCTLIGELDDVKRQIIEAAEKEIRRVDGV